jgi:hypothetical protein
MKFLPEVCAADTQCVRKARDALGHLARESQEKRLGTASKSFHAANQIVNFGHYPLQYVSSQISQNRPN